MEMQRGDQIKHLLRLGTEGAIAAENLLNTLHFKKLTRPIHYFDLIEHFVNNDADWDPESELLRALSWYRKGIEIHAQGSEDLKHIIKIPEIEEQNTGAMYRYLTEIQKSIKVSINGEKGKGVNKLDSYTIDLQNNTRGVATIKVVDTLLQIRNEWINTAVDTTGNSFTTQIEYNVGPRNEKSTVLYGAVTRLLKERFNPPIVPESVRASGAIVFNKDDLLNWFQSSQALSWSREEDYFQ